MPKDNGGNGDNGHGTFHFWKEVLMKEAQEEEEGPTVMEEYHLDCQGRKRLFRLIDFRRGPHSFLRADEVPEGLHFSVSYDESQEVAPWYRIRKKIAARLATRDIVRDPGSGRLEVLDMLVRAQVGPTDDDGLPELVIDDEQLTWEQLGQILSTYEGWELHIRIEEP